MGEVVSVISQHEDALFSVFVRNGGFIDVSLALNEVLQISNSLSNNLRSWLKGYRQMSVSRLDFVIDETDSALKKVKANSSSVH